MPQPLLKMAKVQDTAHEGCPDAKSMDISQNSEVEVREPSLGLLTLVPLMQGRKSCFSLQNKKTAR